MRPGLFRQATRPMVQRQDGNATPATDQEMLNQGHARVGQTPAGEVWHTIGTIPDGAEVIEDGSREWSWLDLVPEVAGAVLRKAVRLHALNAGGGRDRVHVPMNAVDPVGDTEEADKPPHEWRQ